MIPYRTRQSLKRTLSCLLERAHAGFRDSIPSVVCLCYHSVNERESPASIHPHIFRTQLSYLREHNFQFLTMGELVNRLRRGAFPARPTAVVTFDDGFEDNRTEALPILLELGITATFFICTGLVTREQRTLHRFEQWTGHPYRYLDLAQIIELRQAGMEIGAHTHSHRNLATLPRDEAKQELTLSKTLLEGLMQEPVRYLAYPYGKRGIHYTGETVGLLSECGYESAASISFRRMRAGQRHSLFEIPRFFVLPNDSSESFRQKVDGHFDWLGSFQFWSPRWLKKLISPEDNHD